MNKAIQKISDKLEGHDSIIMTCSSFGCKNILTLEQGYVMYWVRIYKDGKLYEQKHYKHFKDAVGSFYRHIKKLDFKFNYYDGGLEHYEHKQ